MKKLSLRSLGRSKVKTKEGFKAKPKNRSELLAKFQRLGRALIFPIAVLPFAALLNRFGALGVQVATQAGHLHQAD